SAGTSLLPGSHWVREPPWPQRRSPRRNRRSAGASPQASPRASRRSYGGGEFFAQRVNKLTDGQFTIRALAPGDLVPAFEALDAVQQGTVELCPPATYYYVGKDFTMGFGTALPFGLTTRQQNAWMYHGGGVNTLNAFFKDFGVVGFPAGNTG